MKPDWKDAPKWAQWLAMDEDGEWWWFELEPYIKQDCWYHEAGNLACAYEPRRNWIDSLEQRP